MGILIMDKVKTLVLGIIGVGLILFAFSFTHEQGYRDAMREVNIDKHKGGPCWYCPVGPLKEIASE